MAKRWLFLLIAINRIPDTHPDLLGMAVPPAGCWRLEALAAYDFIRDARSCRIKAMIGKGFRFRAQSPTN